MIASITSPSARLRSPSVSGKTKARTRWHPTICRRCRTREGPISSRGLCTDCAVIRQTEAIEQLVDKQGPVHDRWLAGLIDYAQRNAETG